MKPIANIPYSEDEQPHLEKLRLLFMDWHARFTEGAFQLANHTPDDIVCDGFYPGYFDQKPRILFVGRESRQISGYNNLDVLFEAYRTGKKIGGRKLNGDRVHSRMLRVAHGLLRNMPPWENIPEAEQIGDSFGTPEGISFAFMNISKLSNESDDFQSDWPVIEAAHRLSNHPRRLTEEEVALLQPDIVITMNLGDKLTTLGGLTKIETLNSVASYSLNSVGHNSLLLDTFHFSAWNKDDVLDFYEPICQSVSSAFQSMRRHGS